MNDNPFYRPCVTFKTNLSNIAWEFPYLPAFINAAVLVLILVILAALFMTVGIAAQISTMFYRLIEEAGAHMRSVPAVEKSGYAVAIGIYLLVFIPLWLIQAPFQLLGIVWERFGFYTLIAIALAIGAFFVDWHSIYEYVGKLNDSSYSNRSNITPQPQRDRVDKDTRLRTWSNRDGEFSTEAEFVGFTDGFVTLKKPDGTTIKVGFDELSNADTKWILEAEAKK